MALGQVYPAPHGSMRLALVWVRGHWASMIHVCTDHDPYFLFLFTYHVLSVSRIYLA